MFKVILQTQWTWSRMFVLLGVVLAFLLPVLTVQRIGIGDASDSFAVGGVLSSVENWSVWYSALAAGLGLLVATNTWAADHRGKHVYALSLPIPRWHYVLLRFGAGALMLLAPALAIWVSSMVATAATEIPESLRVYPHALSVRFALAMLVAYSMFFAISAGTARAAGFVLVAIGGILAAGVLLSAAGSTIDMSGMVADRLLLWPGPLEVFTGPWMLIDI